MNKISHEDITDLSQYCSSFADQIRILNESTDVKNAKELYACANGMVRVSKRIVDKRILGGDTVSDPISKDSWFWGLIVMCIAFLTIGAFIGIGYMAIADLENCAYKGMCVETLKKGK